MVKQPDHRQEGECSARGASKRPGMVAGRGQFLRASVTPVVLNDTPGEGGHFQPVPGVAGREEPRAVLSAFHSGTFHWCFTPWRSA